MTEIDSVQQRVQGYFSARSGRSYVRLMDTPRVWGMPFGPGIMQQAWNRQGDFQRALEEVVQKSFYRCDISSLNCPDPDWAGIIIGAMDTALSARLGRTAPTQFRFLFGQTPLVPIGEPTNYTLFKQALIRLVRDRGQYWEKPPDIWLGRFYRLREGFLDALQLKVFGNDSMFSSDDTKMTWNHSKIVVADGTTALAGGHNLNMDLFRSYPPVHDVSVVVHGPGAAGAQSFLDQMWACGSDLLSQEQFDAAKLTWQSRDPAKSHPANPLTTPAAVAYVRDHQAAIVKLHDDDPKPTETIEPPPGPAPGDIRGHDLRTLPDLTADVFPLRVMYTEYDALPEYKPATGMLAVGKYWRSGTDFQNASELMKQDLILNAKHTIKMSQMDLVSAWKKNWSDHVVCQWLLQALLANKALVVKVVVSPLDAAAGAGGDQYSFGSGAVRTFDLMNYYMTHDVQSDAVLPDPDGRRAEALTRLSVAPLYYTDAVPPGDNIEGDTYKWPGLPKDAYTPTLKQPPLSDAPPEHGVIGSAAMSVLNASGYLYARVPSAPGNHAKLMVIDDEAYVVGSDNLYPGSLSEFNYLIEGPEAVGELLKAYWEPLWRYAGPHARTAGNDPAAPVVRLGPAGAAGNHPFDDTASTQRVSRIDVYHGEIVDGIQATHADGTVDPLRGGNGVPAGGAPTTTLTFSETDPLVGISGEWGTWYGGRYITKIQFHQRSGAASAVFGTGTPTSNVQPFDLRASSPQSQQVTGFFGSGAAANNNANQCLGSIGIVLR